MVDEDLKMRLEGKFDDFKGRIKEAWGVVNDDDLSQTEGKWDQVVGAVKEKTGKSADEIEKKLDELVRR